MEASLHMVNMKKENKINEPEKKSNESNDKGRISC